MFILTYYTYFFSFFRQNQPERDGEDPAELTISAQTNDSDIEIPIPLPRTQQPPLPPTMRSSAVSARHGHVSSVASLGTIKAHFTDGTKHVLHSVKSNYWKVLGTAGAWFILDVIFYGNGLFSGQVCLFFIVFHSFSFVAVDDFMEFIVSTGDGSDEICTRSSLRSARLIILAGLTYHCVYCYFLHHLRPK